MGNWPPDPAPPSASWPPPPPPNEPPPPSAPPVLPWEQPGVPWTTGLFETVKLLLTRPREAFERMPITGDVLRPFVFALVVSWIGAICSILWSLPFGGPMPDRNMPPGFTLPPAPVLLTVFVLCAPVFYAFSILVLAGIDHVMLMIVGGARNGFTATLRVVCYSQAGQALAILPFCGSLLAAVATFVLTIQGLATAHRISGGKAALAVLLPAIVCCACGILIAVTVGAAIMSKVTHNMMGGH